MPVTGSDADPALRRLLTAARAGLTPERLVRRAHAPRPERPRRPARHRREILAGLDAAGHHRALIFAMHEPAGYTAANDAVLAACAASDGRLLPLARVSPNAGDAVAEARRCLAAGARGFKLHPRSDAFTLPHPAVEEVVALAHEARAPVLFHAGPRHPAPRRGRRRPRAALPGGPAHPRPRGHQRPGLDPAVRRRAAEPLLRHRLVVHRRPARSSTPTCRRAGSSTGATCPTAPAPWPRSSSAAARAAVGLGDDAVAGDRRRPARARGDGAGAARRRPRARARARSARARSTPSAS